VKTKTWIMIALATVLSMACGTSDVKRMTKEELKAVLGDANLVIVDVRQPSQWKESRLKIAGALHEDPKSVDAWMGKYPKDKTLVFYCA